MSIEQEKQKPTNTDEQLTGAFNFSNTLLRHPASE